MEKVFNKMCKMSNELNQNKVSELKILEKIRRNYDQGKLLERKRVAKSLLKSGMDIKQVHKHTCMDIDELEKLKDSLS
jgi:hypothetical protein